MAPSPTRIRSASSSLRSRLKKVTSLRTFLALARWREASSIWYFDSSLGVSSAGVGTWHEASASPRRLPRLRRAHPSTALDERRRLSGVFARQLHHDREANATRVRRARRPRTRISFGSCAAHLAATLSLPRREVSARREKTS